MAGTADTSPATLLPLAAPAEGAAPLQLTPELREQFRQQIPVTAIRIPKQKTSQYMKQLSKHLLNKPRLKNVADDPTDPGLRLLLLDEGLAEADLAAQQLEGEEGKTVADLVRADGLSVTATQIAVDYSYWPAHVVLRRLLPDPLEVPCSFESVGHVAHLNLRRELLPYKHVIGQVILDKNPRMRTVVNKVASIENEFRVFPMELLAGEEGTETEVRQHGAVFRLDFRKVYWNSRLEREHQRLVQLFRPGEVVLDAMAGIGPFAVPAAQKGCLVYANDLNPASYHYLCTNIRLNRVAGKALPFNADARHFMAAAAAGGLDVAAAAAVVPPGQARKGRQQQRQERGEGAAEAEGQRRQQQQQGTVPASAGDPADANTSSSGNGVFHHVVMNLPADAVEFLDALNGTFCPRLWTGQQLPLVHVYAFAKGEQELAGIRQRVEAGLGGPLDGEPKVHAVRDVAPNKLMLCITFRLPAAVAFGEANKRQRLA